MTRGQAWTSHGPDCSAMPPEPCQPYYNPRPAPGKGFLLQVYTHISVARQKPCRVAQVSHPTAHTHIWDAHGNGWIWGLVTPVPADIHLCGEAP